MSRLNELNKLLEEIYNKVDLLTRSPSNDFVDDYVVYISILSDEYDKVDINFWNYLRKKYSLPEIDSYFHDYYELLKVVYDQCIRPFYLRLDILPNYRDKYNKLSSEFEKNWKINRFFYNNWINLLVIILMILFFTLAVNTEVGSIDHSIFISLSTGFLISLIISSINFAHRKRLRKKKSEVDFICYQFELLKSKYNEVHDKIKKDDIKSKSKFVTEFCVFNNSINNFIDRTKNILSIQSSSIYHWFIDFEKEIFEFSSKIVNKEFKEYMMDQTTDEEVGILQKYIIQFGYWVNAFEMDLLSLKHDYDDDIIKMEDKEI